MNNTSKLSGQPLLGKDEIKPSIILLAAAIFPTIHRTFGSIEFAQMQPSISTIINPALFMFLSAFFLFGVIPVLLIKFNFKESYIKYGIKIGDWKFGLASVSILFPLIAVLLRYPAALTDEIRAFYPFERSVTNLSSTLMRMELWRCLFYYSAWEFFFRGFMLFGLRCCGGDWLTICIQTFSQCLIKKTA